VEAQRGVLSDAWWATLWRRRPLQLLAAAVAACALFAVGFLVGKHQSPITVLTGVAAVGDHQAQVTAGGWTYGFSDSVEMWIDSQGSLHEGGWPSCLRLGQRPTITFGAVPVSLPGDYSWRQVVWVDCRG
jgi:hypothetical protein